MHYEEDKLNKSARNKCLDCEFFSNKKCELGNPININKRMLSCNDWKSKYEKQRNKTV